MKNEWLTNRLYSGKLSTCSIQVYKFLHADLHIDRWLGKQLISCDRPVKSKVMGWDFYKKHRQEISNSLMDNQIKQENINQEKENNTAIARHKNWVAINPGLFIDPSQPFTITFQSIMTQNFIRGASRTGLLSLEVESCFYTSEHY